MIEIKNLVKRYPSGQQALKGVNLTVPDDSVIALIGPSGAGKALSPSCAFLCFVFRCKNR